VLSVSSGFFLGALRCSLLYLRCNWVALNLCFFFFIYIYNITYKKKGGASRGVMVMWDVRAVEKIE
jgi:hypothetical protein